MRQASAALAFVAALAFTSCGTKAQAQPTLPQWLPVQTLDKPFNEAAGDLEKAQRFVLRDCGNSGGNFICTYSSERGIGIAAWARQPVGFVEQLAIAIPRCNAMAELTDLAAMLIYILHPRRPLATYPRAIVAMANFAANKGPGEHWLDGVSYQLIDRGVLGLGLVVRRAQHDLLPPNDVMRKAVAAKQHFYMPEFACPDEATGTVAPPRRRAIERKVQLK